MARFRVFFAMLPRIAALVAASVATLAAVSPAQAASGTVGAYVDNVTESPDGATLANTTTVSLIGVKSIAGWKLTADVSYKAVRGGTPSLEEQRRSGREVRSVKAKSAYDTFGTTDTRITAERSFALPGKISLDLLTRATLPTGKRGNVRSRGRYEVMVDAGLRKSVAGGAVWAGTARRFRSSGYDVPGRDINENYAGASAPITSRTTVRADYLRAQSPYQGFPAETSVSLGMSHTLRSGMVFDLYGTRYNDAFGRGNQVGLSLRMPTSVLV